MSTKRGTTEYPNTFKRQGDFPLDITSRFDTMEDAENYAANNLTAYGGQIITVKNSSNKYKAYVLQPCNEPEINFTLEVLQAINLELNDEIIFDAGHVTDMILDNGTI